jgi:CheY-like chemotaxis protein
VDPLPTILVVDDVPLFRELEALFLARCGRVITAATGREALAIAERERPAVIVLDAHLPDLPGEEVCRLLKLPHPGLDLPVVVVTGSGAADEHAAAIRAGEPTGLGVRFLELDAPAARRLDAYVHEWAHPDALAFAMPRASGGIP